MSIPLTILGGFLGAGKTTALNHLLRHAGARIAVLVNDFGSVNIDAALIEAADGDVVALSNGCVCCAVGPDLGEALSRLLQRSPPPGRIVIEASGVSDPWRIAQLVKLQPGVSLDAVLVLVDAANFATHLRDRWLADTLERQVARADLIVVTKCDLADPGDARDAVLRLRPDARIAAAEGGAIPDALLGIGGASPGRRWVADVPGHGLRTWHWAAEQRLARRVCGWCWRRCQPRFCGRRGSAAWAWMGFPICCNWSGSDARSMPIPQVTRAWVWC